MKKYKIKLQSGDYVASSGLSLKQYEEIGNRFIDDGCPRLEFPNVNVEPGFPAQKWFGWSRAWGGFYHANVSAFEGRLLTYSEIMELAVDEKWSGECFPVVGSIVEYCGTGKIEGRVYDEWRAGDKLEVMCLKSINGETVPVCFNLRYESVSSMGVEFLRPIKSDREKAIEFAHEIIKSHRKEIGNYNDKTQLGALYDTGLLKLPEEK